MELFGCIHKIYYNLVMGIINKQNNPPQEGEDFVLTRSELEFLILLIKRSTFTGEQLEEVYNTVYKLQQQYLNIK